MSDHARLLSLEVAAREWVAAETALHLALAEREDADQVYADAVQKAFDTLRTPVERGHGRSAIAARAAACEAVRVAALREQAARDILLKTARMLG